MQSGKSSGAAEGGYVGSMQFLPGQAGIDKKGQDEMELFLRNWQAEGSKAPVTLAVEASDLERQQMQGHLDQAKRYLITRGIPASLVATQVQSRPVTGGGRLSMHFDKAAAVVPTPDESKSHHDGKTPKKTAPVSKPPAEAKSAAPAPAH